MIIESELHYNGSLEMITRLSNLIIHSYDKMLIEDFTYTSKELISKIQVLELAISDWKNNESIS